MSASHWLSATEIAQAYAAKTLTPRQLLLDLLTRIQALDPKLNAFIRLDADGAMADAVRADQEIAAGRSRGPLHGVPVGIKDIIDVAGLPTTGHSKILVDNIAKADAVVTRKLREAGAIIIGKLSTHEFAIGGPSFDLPFPPARNPWNLVAPSGRVVVGIRRRCRSRAVPGRARHRHRRIGTQSCQCLRHRRPEADIRSGVAARGFSAVLHFGPRRSADPHRRGRRTHVGCHRRPRSGRPG